MPSPTRIFALLALLMALAAPVLAQGVDNVSILDFPHPPYAFGQVGEHPDKGISVRIARKIFSRMALPCVITLAEWPDALAKAKKGETDGLALLMKTPERESFLLFSSRILTSSDRLFYLESNLPGFTWNDVRDLGGKRVGLVRGYAYGADFVDRARAAGAVISVYPDTSACLNALFKKQIDLAADEEAVAGYRIKANPLWRNVVKPAPKPIASTPYFMGISKKSKAASLMPDINRVIDAIKNDGSLKAILAGY